jgi:hypothetical protein
MLAGLSGDKGSGGSSICASWNCSVSSSLSSTLPGDSRKQCNSPVSTVELWYRVLVEKRPGKGTTLN